MLKGTSTAWTKFCQGQRNECWLWQGSFYPDGYGRHSSSTAHRAVWILMRGAIPIGMTVDHVCRNRACVNPDHMELVTPRENTRRGFVARQSCRHGHPYTPENTRLRGGTRECRACDRRTTAAYKARKLAMVGAR